MQFNLMPEVGPLNLVKARSLALTTAGIPAMGVGDAVIDVIGARPTASAAMSYLMTIKAPVFA